jgi:YHS domain-containing protein
VEGVRSNLKRFATYSKREVFDRKEKIMVTLTDPVCGMRVDESAFRADGYDDVAFCAPGCRSTFLADPSRYIAVSSRTEPALSHDSQVETEPPTANQQGGCCGGHGHHAASTGTAGS